jgi:kynureninase
MNARLQQAMSGVGSGSLQQDPIQQHIAPLFSRVLSSDSIYLANHSLGRPLDAMADDVAEATAAWYSKLGDAWDAWLEERQAFRSSALPVPTAWFPRLQRDKVCGPC